MKAKLEFNNGECQLIITPCDDWEQKMLGAVAKGGDKLNAIVTYKPEGHFSYGKCSAVNVRLVAGCNVDERG